jgi:hypothetical protein
VVPGEKPPALTGVLRHGRIGLAREDKEQMALMLKNSS